MNKLVNISAMFKKEFKIGDEVIIVHADTKLYHGKIKRWDYREIVVGGEEHYWSDVVLIAHDGFPCRAFHSTLNMEQFDKLENWEHMLMMYKGFGIPLEGLDVDKPFGEQPKKIKQRASKIETYDMQCGGGGFGCPFEFEDVRVRLLNPLNGLVWSYEETLLMRSKDGAIGMLWDIEREIFDLSLGDVA